ncbi:hypothetical protein LINPERHAP1_LOCUS30425, partial [Linum perenne]
MQPKRRNPMTGLAKKTKTLAAGEGPTASGQTAARTNKNPSISTFTGRVSNGGQKCNREETTGTVKVTDGHVTSGT